MPKNSLPHRQYSIFQRNRPSRPYAVHTHQHQTLHYQQHAPHRRHHSPMSSQTAAFTIQQRLHSALEEQVPGILAECLTPQAHPRPRQAWQSYPKKAMVLSISQT